MVTCLKAPSSQYQLICQVTNHHISNEIRTGCSDLCTAVLRGKRENHLISRILCPNLSSEVSLEGYVHRHKTLIIPIPRFTCIHCLSLFQFPTNVDRRTLYHLRLNIILVLLIFIMNCYKWSLLKYILLDSSNIGQYGLSYYHVRWNATGWTYEVEALNGTNKQLVVSRTASGRQTTWHYGRKYPWSS